MQLKFTAHARERMAQMDVTPEEALTAVEEATMTWPDAKGKRRVHCDGRLVVVTECCTVITVSWDTPGHTYTDRRTGR